MLTSAPEVYAVVVCVVLLALLIASVVFHVLAERQRWQIERRRRACKGYITHEGKGVPSP